MTIQRKTSPAEAHLAATQALAQIGSWEWNLQDNTVWWSDELYRVCGFEPGAFSPTFDSFFDLLHPDDRETALAEARRATEVHEPCALDLRVVRSDGQVRSVHARGQVLLDAGGRPAKLICTAQDVTDREATRRLSDSRLRAIINAEPACVKLVSRDGRLLDMNPAGLAMIDATDLAQVAGRSIIDLVHPDDRARFLEVHRAAGDGRPARAEFRIIGLTGRERWVESHSVPFAMSDGERAILSVTSDITERKQLEAQLRQSQKMEAVGRLAGGIAHDFNNLLTVIGGYTETALGELPEDTPVAEALREVYRAAGSASALTRQLLTFSRQQILRLVPLDINAVVADLERLLRRALGEDIEIITSLPAGIPAIHGDATQLQQVLMNIALNARDAMPRGGRLTIETNTARDGSVLLRVGDSGCGMSDETLAHVFEPFFTTKPLGQGAGLGLATVYAIVTSMGGTIQVASDLGRGTTFTLQFPASRTPVDETAPAPPPTAGMLTGSERILLVEDEDQVRRFAASVLKGAGYDVIEAARPSAALQLAKQHGASIRLLLSDIIMPEFDGVELMQRFRELYPDIPVLFMSGYSLDTMARHGLTVDQYDLLMKPFSKSDLLQRVRQVLVR
jgi:PAS domain S-box-containing protein